MDRSIKVGGIHTGPAVRLSDGEIVIVDESPGRLSKDA
jgi:hypothetical protein